MQSVKIKRHRPLAIINKSLITYHTGCICSVDLYNNKVQTIYKLPVSAKDSLFMWSRLYERLFRREIRAAVKADESHLIYVFDKTVYCLNIITGENREELKLRKGTSSPYYFCKLQGIRGFEDGIVFGEYLQNPDRLEKVGIYRRSIDTEEWKCVYRFPAGSIRHIHGIVSAPEHKCVYILTGDRDNEAGLWKATDDFSTVEPYVIGSQQNRAVHLYPVGDKLIYATDTPNEPNYIYSIDGKNRSINKIQTINGSCIYASESKDFIFISSTVEPDERIRGWRSWINYKLGPGILSKEVCVYKIWKESLRIEIIATFHKDAFPYKLFQYGQCDSIYDEERMKLLLYPIAVKKYDGKLLEI